MTRGKSGAMGEVTAGRGLRLTRGGYVLTAVVMISAALALDYLPILTPEQRQTFAIYYAQLPMAWLAVLATALVLRRSVGKQQKLFWSWLLLGFSCFLAALIGFAIFRDAPHFVLPNLLVGAFGPATILCVLIAATQDPHLQEDPSGQAYLRRNRAVGYLTLGFALFFYFALIPARLYPEHYSIWAPESLPYLLLESVALGRFLLLWLGCSSQRWRAVYGWMAACFALWALGDVLFLLEDAHVWKIRYATLEDLWFYLPYVALLLAIQSGQRPATTATEESDPFRPSRFAMMVSRIPSSAFLFLLPTMHIALTSVTPMPPKLQLFRGILVLALLPFLFRLAWREQFALQEQNIQANARREKAELLFENIFERAPEAYYLVDLQGRFVSGNRAAEKMIGYSREELIGKHIATCGLVSGTYQCKALAALTKNLIGIEVDNVELFLNHKNGSQVPVEIRAFPIEYSGRMLVLGMACDISERKRAEEQLQARLDERTAELREANARYRQVVDQVPAVTYICEVGCDGKWQYVSKQTESMFGFTPQEWMAAPSFWIEHVHPDDRNRVRVEEELCQHGSFYRLEYRLQTKKSDYRWVRDEAQVYAGPEGVLLMHGILLDIHEAKLLEEQLRHSQKLEAIGHLAGGIAHDFNNLLNIIMGYSELLLSPNRSTSLLHDGLTSIFETTKRGAALTQQLLAFSRKQVLQPQVMDLNHALSEVQKMLSRVMGEDIELVTNFHCSETFIEADPNQIERMLINLAINAREAMPSGGRLVIETANVTPEDFLLLPESSRHSSKHVRLMITDTGNGMDAQTIDHIFEPFFTTKQRGQGTGLGLAQVYGIVQQSDGSISVSSTPGEGSAFRIFFPLVEGKRPPETPLSIAGLKGTETILLVEDEKELRAVTAAFLEASGYRVLEAGTPALALDLSNSVNSQIDLLITDVIMPGMNGRQLADILVEARPSLRVIFMSGYTDDKISGAGLQYANMRFLAKPFTQQKLGLMVRQALDQARS